MPRNDKKNAKGKGGGQKQGFKIMVIDLPSVPATDKATIDKLIDGLPQELYQQPQAGTMFSAWLQGLRPDQQAQFYKNALLLQAQEPTKLLEALKDIALAVDDQTRVSQAIKAGLMTEENLLEAAEVKLLICLSQLKQQPPPQGYLSGDNEKRNSDWQEQVNGLRTWLEEDGERKLTTMLSLAPLAGPDALDVLTKLISAGLTNDQKLIYLKGIRRWQIKQP